MGISVCLAGRAVRRWGDGGCERWDRLKPAPPVLPLVPFQEQQASACCALVAQALA